MWLIMKGRKDRKGLQIFDEITEYCLSGKSAPSELSRGQFITKLKSQEYFVMGKYAVKIVAAHSDIFKVSNSYFGGRVPCSIFKFTPL